MTKPLGQVKGSVADGGPTTTRDCDLISYRSYGPGAPGPAADLARLHRKLLPGSPIHDLGPAFVERFYFGVLPEEGLVFGQVAYEGNRPIGFVVVTDDANGFLGHALRRRWPTLAAVTLRHPPSPRGAWNILRLYRERERASGDASVADVAEILSLGVLQSEPGHRPSRERRGIARAFVRWAVEQVPDRPVQALVDESNLAARVHVWRAGMEIRREDPGRLAGTADRLPDAAGPARGMLTVSVRTRRPSPPRAPRPDVGGCAWAPPSSARSAGAGTGHHDRHRLHDNAQVVGQRPIVDVVLIEPLVFLKARLRTPRHLPHAGDTWHHPETLAYVVGPLVDLRKAMRVGVRPRSFRPEVR